MAERSKDTCTTLHIPTSLRDLLVKLEFLGMIERGKKINVSTLSFTDAESWVGAVQRRITGEGKKGLVIFINQLIVQAITAMDEYQTTDLAELISCYLSKARDGIMNLLITYQNDPCTVAEIMICARNIDFQLTRHGCKSKT